jgi:hypothetical protein
VFLFAGLVERRYLLLEGLRHRVSMWDWRALKINTLKTGVQRALHGGLYRHSADCLRIAHPSERSVTSGSRISGPHSYEKPDSHRKTMRELIHFVHTNPLTGLWTQQSFIEGSRVRIEAYGNQSGHVECAAQGAVSGAADARRFLREETHRRWIIYLRIRIHKPLALYLRGAVIRGSN